MLISRVIEQARSGELNNLSVEGFTDTKVISYINLGLIELYKRFSLRTEEAVITMRDSKTIYTLSDVDTDVSIETGIDVMVITEVYDEGGALLPINVESDDYSILTPSYNTIQVPYPAEGEILSVIFTAGPIYISVDTQSLEIPISLLEALLHYIGYRAHGAIDGNIQTENNTHYQRFEASCNRAIALGIVTADDTIESDVRNKGFI